MRRKGIENRRRNLGVTVVLASTLVLSSVALVENKEVVGTDYGTVTEDGGSSSILRVGKYTPKTKEIEGHHTDKYDDGEFRGTLERYVFSGTPSDTKYVERQTTSSYNKDGYTGTLQAYTERGESLTKFVTEQLSANYSDSSGYTGTLSEYVYSGTPEHTQSYTATVNGNEPTWHKNVNFEPLPYEVGEYIGVFYFDTVEWTTHPNSVGISITHTQYSSNNSSPEFNVLDGDNILETIKSQFGEDNPNGQYFANPIISTMEWDGGIQTGSFVQDGVTYPYKREATVIILVDGYTYEATYKGDFTKPDTQVYRYEGNVTKLGDLQTFYRGNVTRPDTREYRYKGTVYEIDKDAPEITFETDGNDKPRTEQGTVVHVEDDFSGVAMSEYQWTTSPEFPEDGDWKPFTSGDNITISEGTGEKYLHILAIDTEGNVSQKTTNPFNLENTPPEKPEVTVNTEEYTNLDVIVDIVYKDEKNEWQYKIGDGEWEIYTEPLIITENTTIYAREVSESGLMSEEQIVEVNNIYREKPKVVIKGNPSEYTEDDEVVLSIDATENEMEIKGITLPDGSYVEGDEATYVVTENGDYEFIVEDIAGNQTTKSITVDKIKVPYYIYVVDSNGNGIEGAEYELIRNGEVYVTSTSDAEGRVDFGKVPADGEYTIRQTKTNGGVEIKEPEEIETDISDPSTPDNPITSTVGEELNKPIITVSDTNWTNKRLGLTVEYDGKSEVKQVKIGGGDWLTYTEGMEIESNTVINARSFDVKGNWSPTEELSVGNIDTEKPTIEATQNTETWVGDEVLITVIAKDSLSGVGNIQSEDNLELVSTKELSDGKEHVYKVITEGTYRFSVTDRAGNTDEITHTVDNMDNTAPWVEVKGNVTDWYKDYELNLQVTVGDAESGVDSVTLPDGKVLTGEEALSFSYPVTKNGEYKFEVRDKVGNSVIHTETVTHLEKSFSIHVEDVSGQGLAGVEFELYRDGVKLGNYISDSNGKLDFGKVYTSGNYELKQVKSLEGYRLNSKVLTVDVTDDDYKVVNYLKTEEMPSTGTIGLALTKLQAILGVMGIVAVGKRKNRLEKN